MALKTEIPRFGSQPKRRRAIPWTQVRFGSTVLTPVLIWFCIFLALPIFQTVWLSFRQFNSFNLSVSTFTGFGNYIDVITDQRFIHACANSAIYLVLSLALIIPVAMFLAVLLERTRHRQFYMFALYVPTVMSVLATSVLFRFLYNPNFGLFNQVLQFFNIPSQTFIYSPNEALASLVVMDVWKSFGFYTIILLAGALQIPQEFREAAALDGAGSIRYFWLITLPLMRPVLLMVTVMVTIHSLQVFSSAYAISAGTFGPQDSLLTLSGLIYQTGIVSTDIGYAGAASVVLFLVTVIVTIAQFRFLRSSKGGAS